MVDNLIHGDLTNHSHMNVTGCLGKTAKQIRMAYPTRESTNGGNTRSLSANPDG